jgi:hypothetical protein
MPPRIESLPKKNLRKSARGLEHFQKCRGCDNVEKMYVLEEVQLSNYRVGISRSSRSRHPKQLGRSTILQLDFPLGTAQKQEGLTNIPKGI